MKALLAAPIALALALALAPAPASACSPDPCWGTWQAVAAGNGDLVPTDGVLVVRETTGSWTDPALAGLAVSVTRDGAPVDGALETVGLTDAVIWRPAAPLEPGATYALTITGGDCKAIDETLLFQAGDGPAPPLAAPALTPTEEVEIAETIDLEHLVCCDGAYPEESFGACDGSSAYWVEGACASTLRTGTLVGTWAVGDGLPPALAGMVAYRQSVDGGEVFTTYGAPGAHRSQTPYCASIELVNLADGASIAAGSACFGEAPESPLGGPYEVTPTCGEAPYTCAIIDDGGRRWDPAQCTPYGDAGGATGGDDDGGKVGCACRSDASRPGLPGALALVVAAAPRRRRRRT